MAVATATHPIVAARDKLAVWLTTAEPMLQVMLERKEPAFKEAFEVWSKKRKFYERLCGLHPEVDE